jgi:protein SCO1/2
VYYQNKIFAIGLISLIFTGCQNQKKQDIDRLPFFNKPDFSPEWINSGDLKYADIHQIPDFTLINQSGDTIRESDVDNHIYVANFIFTRCMSICPKMTENMKIIQEKYKSVPEILFLSHSVTPDIDTVPVLKKFGEKYGIIEGKWHLLTGDRDQIYKLAKKEYFAGDTVGFYSDKNEFLHTENFLLIDQKRRIRGVYNGTLQIEMQRLIDDIEMLRQEDSD